MPNPFYLLTRNPDKGDAARRSTYADVTERLLAEFGTRYGLKLVSDMIMSGRTGEDGLPALIAPEFLEHVVRNQLNDLSPTESGPAS